MTINEIKQELIYVFDNNKSLIEMGETPKSINLEGPAGCAKTSILKQIADEKGMGYSLICISQLEEVSDLIGFPIKEYEVVTENGTKFVPADLIHECDLETTGRSRMSYAPPAWLPKEENPNGTILVLDDWTRAN